MINIAISAFASLVCVPVGITSSVGWTNICTIILGIKKYKSIIKKKKKNQDQIELLGKGKVNTIEVLISKALINSCISHNDFVSRNNVFLENITRWKRK